MNRWGVIAGIAALTAGGAALRAIFLRYPSIDSDQAVIGLMGIHILRGEFPIYFWGEPYSGTLESFVAALTFFLFGVSRLTLNVVPFLFSLIFLLLTWRLGLVIFDRLTGLLGLALAAFPPMLLTWHSVLARGNYIENLVLGNLLLLLTLKLARPDLRPAAHCRALLVYGLVFGFAWYMSFQSVHYLIVSVLFLLWRGRRSLLVRQGWIGCVGALLGSFPFWIYNLTSGFSSVGAIRWYARGASPLEAFTLFVSVKLPVFLGASGFPYNFESLVTRQLPSLEWVILGLYSMSFLLVLAAIAYPRITGRSDRWRGAELLLLLPLLVGGITVAGGFGAGRDPRYLLPIYTAAPLLLAAMVRAITRWSRVLAILTLGVVLSSNLYGNLTTAEGLPRYQLYLDNDRALLGHMRERGLRYAFSPEFWFSYRLIFDANESIIAATPFWRDYPREVSKYPAYTRRVAREAPSAYVLWGGANSIEQTLRAAGERYEKTVVGRLTLFHDFKPPRSGGRSLSAAAWRPREGSQREAFDRDPTTRWRGAAGERLTIDLGGISTLVGISVHLGEESLRAPHGLQALVSTNGAEWELAVSAGPLIPGFAWMGERLILEEHGRIRLSLARVPARYLAIQLPPGSRSGAWTLDELFVYAEGDESRPARDFWEVLEGEDHGQRLRAVRDSLRLLSVTPDLEAAHILFRIALLNLGLPLDWSVIERYVATNLARQGKSEEAISFYRSLVDRQPFRARAWQDLEAAYEALGAFPEAQAIAEEARPQFTPAISSRVRFGWTFELLGHELEPETVAPGEWLHLTLIWRALRAPVEDYAIFVRFTSVGRRAFGKDHYPLQGVFPTSRWERGEVIRDEDRIQIPPNLAPGRYQINLGVWLPETREQLRVWRGWLPTGKKSVPLGELTVISARQDGGA